MADDLIVGPLGVCSGLSLPPRISGSRFYLEEPGRPLECLEGRAQSVNCRSSTGNKGTFLALMCHLAAPGSRACLGLSLQQGLEVEEKEGAAHPGGSKCTREQRSAMSSEAGAAEYKCGAALRWEANRDDELPCFPSFCGFFNKLNCIWLLRIVSTERQMLHLQLEGRQCC